tara:strand:- start:379 stop:603 length:225 start_codon:yes stop_codon:yes gene_type:complete
MSKKTQEQAETQVQEQAKVLEEVSKGKTEEELKEIATTLQAQLQHHKTMAVKAQGALEVILQMLPEFKDDGEQK